ncbi:MAG: FtsX-like permease family protein [Verrucomicrobiota bacterium]
MEQVGFQKKLSFERAFKIAVQGIRIRLGRSLVTVSGVVLGIAFLMSNLTGQLIKNSVAADRELRQTVSLMQAMINGEVGDLTGKRLAVATYGKLSPPEQALLASLTGKVELATNSAGAALLLVLGDAPAVPVSLAQLTAGMTQAVVLDSLAPRQFSGPVPATVRRELFFGARLEQDAADLQLQARQAQFRTRWIVLVSLLVTVIGVSNALLMSVTERFREIGTMKCLGALSAFIRQLFLIESSLIGMAGSIIGAILGAVLSIVAYGFTYRFGVVLTALPYGWLAVAAAGSIVAGSVLSVLAALYPARFASRMVPATALRSTV